MPTTPHPITGEKVPLILGHEFSGVVEEVGHGVDDMKVADRVVVQPIIYDGTCGACKEGLINCCYSGGFVGISGTKHLRSGFRLLQCGSRDIRIRWGAVRACSRASSQCDTYPRVRLNGGRR